MPSVALNAYFGADARLIFLFSFGRNGKSLVRFGAFKPLAKAMAVDHGLQPFPAAGFAQGGKRKKGVGKQ
jgi:hypothetical protein